MKPKNTICLWFDKDAHEAARFYAATFPDSEVTAVHKAPSDHPGGKQSDVLTVEFTVLGIPCLGLNGGPAFKHSEAFSFQVATDNQEETNRYWDASVGNGGEESACGWCKDRWGLSWQITPRALTDALAAGGGEAKRAFEAMMTMKRIDVAAIRQHGEADVVRTGIARRRRASKTIDEYIDRCAPLAQPILRRVRATIARAAPGATETISYGIPAFKLRRILIYFAAFKHHIGLYPPVKGDAALEKAVAPYAGEKGNLRFPIEQKIPYALISRIVKFRIMQSR